MILFLIQCVLVNTTFGDILYHSSIYLLQMVFILFDILIVSASYK